MSAVQLSGDSVVTLHWLHIGDEAQDAVEVGRPETGVFVSLPVEGVALVRWLAEEVPLDQVSARFRDAYGVDTDVADFVREFAGCGFVESIDGHALVDVLHSEAATDAPHGWRLLADVPPGAVAWLLSSPARVAYALAWVGLVVMLVLRPDLWPSGSEAFLPAGTLANLVALTLLGWSLVFLHELAHLAAVRARGCTGSLDLSHRLHILVAQTDMTSVRVLPRHERNAPYLAGMTFDAIVLLTCLALQAASVGSPLPATIAFLAASALLFECALFLRTDLYYVASNVLRVDNLMADSRRWLSILVARIARRRPTHDLADVPRRERRMIPWFAVLMVVGASVVLGQFVLLGLPLLVEFVRHAGAGLDASPADPRWWDSVGLLAVVAIQFVLLGVGVQREQRRRRARDDDAMAGLASVTT